MDTSKGFIDIDVMDLLVKDPGIREVNEDPVLVSVPVSLPVAIDNDVVDDDDDPTDICDLTDPPPPEGLALAMDGSFNASAVALIEFGSTASLLIRLEHACGRRLAATSAARRPTWVDPNRSESGGL